MEAWEIVVLFEREVQSELDMTLSAESIRHTRDNSNSRSPHGGRDRGGNGGGLRRQLRREAVEGGAVEAVGDATGEEERRRLEREARNEAARSLVLQGVCPVVGGPPHGGRGQGGE